MSEPAAQPGAPSDASKNVPEKSLAAAAEKRMPKQAASLLGSPDRTLLRLNKLLATPGGLSTFLSTVNYTLYLIAFLESKSEPLKERLNLLLNRNSTIPKVTPVVPAGPSHFAALGALFSQTRTVLRLLGLFPMYAWARKLAEGSKGQDEVLYSTAVVQCAFYTFYQFLENVAFLTDSKVLPTSYTARWTEKAGGKTTELYRWSYRFWMLGVSCDFVRLAREAQITRTQRAKRTYAQRDDKALALQDQKDDEKFYADCIVPAAWFPMAFHYAEVNDGGVPGWNLGWMAVCGLTAYYAKAKAQWAATE